MDSLLRSAVFNNKAWCELVSGLNGALPKSVENIWGLQTKAPKFYPDVITLDRDLTAQRVMEFIGNRRIYSIKDSYSNIDMSAFGFEVLFRAEWIYHPAVVSRDLVDLERYIINTLKDLEAWTTTYELEDVIQTTILNCENVKIYKENHFGFMANLDANVVGISNVISEKPADINHWLAIPNMVSARFPGVPLVGYEHGINLLAAKRAGWKSLGPLRVWIKKTL